MQGAGRLPEAVALRMQWPDAGARSFLFAGLLHLTEMKATERSNRSS